jgi:type IV secretion system protein VirB6
VGFDSGSWDHWGPYFSGPALLIFGGALVVVGFFEIVFAKIMLAILFATAPLFISFTLFDKTHSFFDRWLGQIAGFSFLMIFVMVVLALCMSFMQWAIGDSYTQHAGAISLLGFVPIMVVGLLGVGLLIKVSHMAQALGGAVCTTSGHELFAGTVGGFVGGALALRSKGKEPNDRKPASSSEIGNKNADEKGKQSSGNNSGSSHGPNTDALRTKLQEGQ